jgi:hypothetical protein
MTLEDFPGQGVTRHLAQLPSGKDPLGRTKGSHALKALLERELGVERRLRLTGDDYPAGDTASCQRSPAPFRFVPVTHDVEM